MKIKERKSARIEIRVPPSVKARIEALTAKEPAFSLSSISLLALMHGIIVLEKRYLK